MYLIYAEYVFTVILSEIVKLVFYFVVVVVLSTLCLIPSAILIQVWSMIEGLL